jgi:hypothetical protein
MRLWDANDKNDPVIQGDINEREDSLDLGAKTVASPVCDRPTCDWLSTRGCSILILIKTIDKHSYYILPRFILYTDICVSSPI